MLHARAVFMCLLFCQSAAACVDFAQTPLEELFCRIQKHDAAALPYSLKEFRKNTVPTQRLLLKRPAQTQGLALPAERAGVPAAPAPGANGQARGAPVKSPAADPAPAQAPAGPVNGTQFPAGCRLLGETIACGRVEYQLLYNRNAALGTEQLQQVVDGFPKYDGSLADDLAVRQYLTGIYRDYIERMVALGLAGVTLSFTKFYHAFHASTDRGGDFAERLVTMFSFLGKDKASMGVARSYTDARPQSLDACAQLGPSLLVCDNVATNWIYQRRP